jgi:hypothetical protein
LKYYKDDGKEHIDGNQPKEISLEGALREIGKLPAIEGNFIGLTNDREDTIQFIRFEEDAWLIDVPILENGAYAYSLQDDDLTTEKVKEIIRRFFSDKNWKSLCNLRKTEQNEA